MIDVLAIEDNQDDVELIRRVLSDSEFAIFNSTRFAIAKDYLKDSDTDVILLDLTLPNGQGVDLVKDAVALAGDIPVIVLTGAENTQLGIDAIDAGASGVVSKNKLSAMELQAIMYAALKHRLETKPAKLTQQQKKTAESLSATLSELEAIMKRKAV